MKLYELLAKIAKGEIKEGTRVMNRTLEDEYIIKNGDLRLCCNGNLFAAFNTKRLNDEIEIIEPAPDNNVGTNRDIEELDWLDIIAQEGEIDMIEVVQRKLNETIRALNELTANYERLNKNEDAKRFG